MDELERDGRVEDGRSRGVAVFSALAIAVVGAFALHQSWQGWLHPLIDAGRDLYIPEQIRDGAKLYRDVAYLYPPFAPYALAGLTAVLGSSLMSYQLIGIGISLLVAATIFGLARSLSGEAAGFAAAFLFASVCMTSAAAYGSNFIFPYSHNVVFGMALFLLFQCAVTAIFVSGGTPLRVATAVTFGALCSLTKIEFAAFVVATIVLWGAVACVTRRTGFASAAKWVSIALSGIGLAWVATWLAFLDAGPRGALLFENVFPSALLAGPVAREFYAKVTGTDRFAFNLVLALAGTVFVGAQVVLMRGVEAIAKRGTGVVRRVTLPIMLVLISIAAALFGTDVFFRGWTVLQIVLVPFAIRDLAALRREPGRTSLAVMPLLLWFSLCGTSRIWLNLAPVWYGFVFILPVLLLIVHVLFAYLPDKGLYTRRTALLWLPLLLVIGVRNLDEQRATYAAKIHPIETSRGVFRDQSRDRAEVIGDFLRYAETNRIPDLVVMPEGLTINYLGSVPSPTRYHTFTPAEMPDVEVEREIVRDLARARPRHIALTTQEAAAFGPRRFGRDYGTEILGYVREHYVVEKEWRTPTFSIVLVTRRIDDR